MEQKNPGGIYFEIDLFDLVISSAGVSGGLFDYAQLLQV